MAITRVQNSSIATSTGGTSVSPSWPGATTAGSLLVLLVCACGTGTTGTITSTGWTLSHSKYIGSNAPKVWVFVKENASSESGSVTVNNTQTDDLWAVLIEYSGIATSSAKDQQAEGGSTTGSTSMSTGTTGTTGQANEVCIGLVGSRNPNTYSAPTNSFTLVDQGNSGNATTSEVVDACWLERIVSATGTYETTVTATSRPFSSLMVTFKEAAAGATASLADSPRRRAFQPLLSM